MERLVFLLMAVIVAILVYEQADRGPWVTPGPGALAADEPSQAATASAPVKMNGYRLTSRASFRGKLRVLSTRRYDSGREADLSPIDLAVGWGHMSDDTVLTQLQISQSGRFAYYHAPKPVGVLFDVLNRQMANIHVIPATAALAKQLRELRRGSVVRLDGDLVDVAADDGWSWHTSLTRTDGGAGACEVLLLRTLSTVP